MGLERFELSTFRLSAERSSQTELQAHRHTIKIVHLLKHYLESAVDSQLGLMLLNYAKALQGVDDRYDVEEGYGVSVDWFCSFCKFGFEPFKHASGYDYC